MNAIDSPKGYALFDLDQTIVPWDTQLLFCNFIIRKEPIRKLYLLLFAPFLPFAKVLGPGGMKRIFLNFLVGINKDDLDAYAQEFVEEIYPHAMYSDILDEVKKHKEAGRTLILNSASPEIWVKHLANKMGFDHYFGTRIDIGKKVSLFPDIIGKNNKGNAKIQRMQHLFPEHWQCGDILSDSYGYSDSQADIPMLDICEHNTMVHPTDTLKKYGTPRQWELSQPKRPTSGKWQFAIACAKQALGFYKTKK